MSLCMCVRGVCAHRALRVCTAQAAGLLEREHFGLEVRDARSHLSFRTGLLWIVREVSQPFWIIPLSVKCENDIPSSQQLAISSYSNKAIERVM